METNLESFCTVVDSDSSKLNIRFPVTSVVLIELSSKSKNLFIHGLLNGLDRVGDVACGHLNDYKEFHFKN